VAGRSRRAAGWWVLSTSDAKKLAEYTLPGPPVANGMAAAAGRLFIATRDGKLTCFSAAN